MNIYIKAESQRDKLIEVLKEIMKCEGAYNPNKLAHAENTIRNMKDIAEDAINEMVAEIEVDKL